LNIVKEKKVEEHNKLKLVEESLNNIKDEA